MAAVSFDRSLWPILVAQFSGPLSDAEFQEYLDTMTRMEGTAERVAVILDARRAAAATSHQRRLQAQWMKDHHAFLRARTAGMAFVIDSAIVRGALTAICGSRRCRCRIASFPAWRRRRRGAESSWPRAESCRREHLPADSPWPSSHSGHILIP